VLIRKIELENITTYKKNTTINFEQGLNLLYGANGTGKSTVLKMIGYALFNYLPGNQKNYVRKIKDDAEVKGRKKYGMIRIWIVGLNDELYIIEKSIGKASPIVKVINERLDEEIRGINNAVQLEEWIRNQIGIDPDINLADLFETSIGVPQGTFTEPFVRTSQKRKDFFNPILQIEIYRKIWNKFKGINKEFKSDLQELKDEETRLSTRLESKGQLEDNEKSYSDTLEKAKKDSIKNKKDLTEKTKEVSELEKLDKDFQTSEAQIKTLRTNVENLKNTNNDLMNRKKDSQDADKICKENEADFHLYEDLLKVKQNLEKDQEALREIDNQINPLTNKITKIETSSEAIKHQIDEIEEQKDNFIEIERNHKKFQELQDQIQVQKRDLQKLDFAEDELEKWRNIGLKSETLIKNLEENLRVLPKIEEKATSTLDNLEKVKDLGNLTRIINEYKTHLKNLEKLHPKKGELLARKEHKNAADKEIKKIEESVREKPQKEGILSNLESQLGDLEKLVDKYSVLKNEFEEKLPKLHKEYDEKLKEKEPLLEELTPLKEKQKSMENIHKKVKETREKLKSVEKNHELYQLKKESAEKYPEIEEKLIKNKEKLSEAKKSLDDWLGKRKDFEAKFNKKEFDQLKGELASLQKEKGILEEKISEAEKNLKDTKEALKKIEETEKKLKIVQDKLSSLEVIMGFVKNLRDYFNLAGPKMTKAFLKQINEDASNNYKDIMDDPNLDLKWDDDYLIHVITPENEKEIFQLSGGEQMAAALAVRLAILEGRAPTRFAFFDEPTTNLDPERRENLSKIIQRIKGFQQIFVISHDDSFEENVDNVIRFTKEENEETKVEGMVAPDKSEALEFIWD